MDRVALEFRGVGNAELLISLAAAIAAALLAYGLWQLVWARSRRSGIFATACGLAAMSAVLIAALRLPAGSTLQRLAWLIILAVVVVLAVGVFYWAVYAYLGRVRILALLSLRFLAILALLLILFEPAISVQPSAARSKLALPVLLDGSASMDTVDQADLPSRYRLAAAALASQEGQIREHFDVSWQHFATTSGQVASAAELAELSPAGQEAQKTDIAAALRRAVEGYSAQDLAGVVLISDGLHNAGGNVVDAAAESPVPIYVIGIGSEDEKASGQRNIRLAAVEAPLEAVRNNVTTIAAKLRITGLANISARVSLSEGPKEVASQQVLAESNLHTADVKLNWTPGEPATPEGPDIRRLRLSVEPNPSETTPDDNAAELHVLVTQPALRVLYVEGTMRPEYKYLRRILSTDPNVKAIALARLEGSRFLSQGSIDGKELTALPRTEEEFGFFDVIIIGDLDRTFLSPEQMERIRKFVFDGKALLMIGGRNSFGPGGYGGTPIEATLPVLCGERNSPQETTPFLPQLTAAGLESPIFAGLGDFFHGPSDKAKNPLPELLGCVSVSSAKAGATVLAVHPSRRDQNGPLIVLAVQQFGKGRSAAFTADTTWQWYLRLHAAGSQGPYHRFWGQMIRFLAGVENKQAKAAPSVLARMDKAYLRQGEELKLLAAVRDGEGALTNEATVSALLRADKEKDVPVSLAKSGSDGTYEAAVVPQAPGRYTATVTATDKNGQKLAEDSLPVIVAAFSKETDRVARDGRLLKAVAEKQGGQYAELSQLPELVNQIIARQSSRLLPAPRTEHYSLYSFPLLFVCFVGLLTTEWLLRRSWQLQ